MSGTLRLGSAERAAGCDGGVKPTEARRHAARRHLGSGDLCREGAPLGQGSRASLLVDLPRDEMALLTSCSPIIWIWVSRATELSAREECAEHLAYRHPLVRHPRAFVTKSGLRHWLDMHREPVFLSTVSLVKIEAAIGRVPSSQQPHICALRNWLDGLITTFRDRIHLVDATVAVRAGKLLPHCRTWLPRYRFHDVVLVATAQTHGHSLLTKREGVFGAWTNIAVPSP
jgi:hypothetical protein